MKNLIKKYRALTFEQRTIFNIRFSIGFNAFLAIGKWSLSYFNLAFLVSGIINLFLMLAKLECFLGVTKPNRKTFRYRNALISIFLILAGVQYSFYMGRLIFTSAESTQYTQFSGIIIATVSFIELGVAIKGCFSAFGRGHYYRNIKLISLSSALTAMALTQMAIMSFAHPASTKVIDGIVGVSVGCIIVLLGIYVFFAPKISILDQRYQRYFISEDSDITSEDLILPLTNSKIYGNFVYVAVVKNGFVEGLIFKKKNPIRYWHLTIKILIIILSEVLIVPYAIGGLIFYFRGGTLIHKLDNKMAEKGCMKWIEEEILD